MKVLFNKISLVILGLLMLSSCEEEDERTVFPHSKPVIEEAKVVSVNSDNPAVVMAGDSIEINALVKDAVTPLSTLNVKIVIGNRLVTDEKIRTKGNESSVAKRFAIPFISELEDGIYPEIILIQENVEGDTTGFKLAQESSILLKRPVLDDKLYLVTNDGDVIELTKSVTDMYIYEATGLDIKGNNISYKIAEKITDEDAIDYSGFVWGDNYGAVEPSDEMSNYIKTSDSQYKTIEKISFNTFDFTTAISGKQSDPGNLYLEDFSDATMGGEAFKKMEISWVNGQEITLNGDLADSEVVLNPTFFDRLSQNKAKFLGHNAVWSVYYSPVRKMVIVSPATPSFPDILFAVGFGLGYPTKVTSDQIKAVYPNSEGRTSTNWERRTDNLLDYIYFRRADANIYEATVYMPGDHNDYASFKFFEDLNWTNEKGANDFTFTGENVIVAASDGNWEAVSGIEHTWYKFRINLTAKTVQIEKVTLP